MPGASRPDIPYNSNEAAAFGKAVGHRPALCIFDPIQALIPPRCPNGGQERNAELFSASDRTRREARNDIPDHQARK